MADPANPGWLSRMIGRLLQPAVQAAMVTTANAASWQELLNAPASSMTVSADSAMRHAAVYRCVTLIAGSIAMLPLVTYRVQPDGDREANRSHPAAPLLALRPNARMSKVTFWRQIVQQMLLRGNGIAWIERTRNGAPVALWPIPWQRTAVTMMDDGALVYRMTLDNMEIVEAHQDDVLHIPGSPVWLGLMAQTPIQAMTMAIGIGLEADGFAKKYFENGGSADGYITYPQVFQSANGQADAIREYWRNRFGGQNRFSGPMVLDQGGKYETISITAEDAQLLETRRFQIEDIGRLFGVPRHLLGMDETSWGSGIEALGISFVTYTLGPHLQAIEDELDWKLFGTAAHHAEFDTAALTQGDQKSTFEAYGRALGGAPGPGWMTVNEVRRRARLPGIEGGDNLTTWTPKGQKPGADGGQDGQQAAAAPGA